MSDSNLPTSEQMDLIEPGALGLGSELLLAPDEQRRRWTGERVARNLQRYQAIIAAIAEGAPVRAICRAYRLSPHTLAAIRAREGLAVATEKKELSALMGAFLRSGVERLVEEVDKIPIGQLSVSLGIISDKKALLDGDPTAIVQTQSVHAPTTPAALAAWWNDMKRAQATAEPDQKSLPSDCASDLNPTDLQ